jgi:hypothetical protein
MLIVHFTARSQQFISQIAGTRFVNGNVNVSLLPTNEQRHNARFGLIVRTLIHRRRFALSLLPGASLTPASVPGLFHET